MLPATDDLPDQYQGDTVAKRRYTVTRTVAGVTTPENLTGVVIRAAFRGPDVLEFAIGTGITVINAAGGVFDLGPFQAPAEGLYRYDLQFDYPDGRRRTYVAGRMRVRADVTK